MQRPEPRTRRACMSTRMSTGGREGGPRGLVQRDRRRCICCLFVKRYLRSGWENKEETGRADGTKSEIMRDSVLVVELQKVAEWASSGMTPDFRSR